LFYEGLEIVLYAAVAQIFSKNNFEKLERAIWSRRLAQGEELEGFQKIFPGRFHDSYGAECP